MDNVKTVQAIYQAFGKGDITAILSSVTDDTKWGFNGARQEIPWHKQVHNKTELPEFFQAFGRNVEIHVFEPRKFVAQGDDVVAEIALEYTVKKTGKRVREEQLHWWTLRDGKVARLQHFEDTAQVAAAFAA